ncbi:hypothetical protein ACIHFE_30335 [Streptomyces sp. NPDC052396]|uniref:hypothetical protein n=1 Tax=Streptomyces sp. NPDC052396 TaxID=3365689 RepID=UPI0037D26C45
MEHRIDPNSPPVHAAGTDPAFVPGLTPTRPAEAEEHPPVSAYAIPDARVEPEPKAEAEAETTVAEEEPQPTADGPVFEVSDRRGSITADSIGVTFRLDDETAEFSWPEIGALEMNTPRFGRRLTVTVYTTNHRSYHTDIEAPNRNLPKQWATELDTVLDSYFQDTETTS